ncbi:MAG TPA: enoyl-CoA hydratase-related protein, partial [Acidimicrobiia bacterium]|nr:enoyl-CoA hydratase-related protein [Acidimicrobiia bacterium]
MSDELLVDVTDGVMTLTINRPDKRNAIDGAVLDGLEAGLHRARRDDDVRVVVLRGAGGYFSAGIDLPFAVGTNLDRLAFMRVVGDVAVALHRLPVPTISVIEGGAYGLACNLALACDLTVATDDAVLCEVFTKLNLSLDGGGAWLLPRIVGLKKAKELAFLADEIPAHEAERLGLVNCVVPAGELEGQVKEWASRLAAGPTTALSLTKAMLNDAYALSFEQAIEEESRSQTINSAAQGSRAAIEGAL